MVLSSSLNVAVIRRQLYEQQRIYYACAQLGIVDCRQFVFLFEGHSQQMNMHIIRVLFGGVKPNIEPHAFLNHAFVNHFFATDRNRLLWAAVGRSRNHYFYFGFDEVSYCNGLRPREGTQVGFVNDQNKLCILGFGVFDEGFEIGIGFVFFSPNLLHAVHAAPIDKQ